MTVESAGDGDLSRRCRQGDPEAWRDLVREYSPLAYRLAFRMLGQKEEAEAAARRLS